jgi:hypothetical protein
LYSVPWRYLGQVLPLRITEEELIVYGRDLEVLARHRRLPRTAAGQRSESPDHRPREDSKQREAHLRACFAELGPAARRFLEGLLKTHRLGKDQAQRVLALLETYRKQDLAAALERAARFGEFLFEIIMRRYELKSTMMTSNRPLEDWGKLIGDVPAATAILDRFLHRAELIHITGKSYRMRDRDDKQPPPENKKRRRRPDNDQGDTA